MSHSYPCQNPIPPFSIFKGNCCPPFLFALFLFNATSFSSVNFEHMADVSKGKDSRHPPPPPLYSTTLSWKYTQMKNRIQLTIPPHWLFYSVTHMWRMWWAGLKKLLIYLFLGSHKFSKTQSAVYPNERSWKHVHIWIFPPP